MNRPGARFLGLCAGLLLLAADRAESTPTFELYVSTGGVTELQVGETLVLRALHPPPTCLPSPYTGERRSPVPPAEMPVVWSVNDARLASITVDGRLTALAPGQVVVQVACRDPNAAECRLTLPGKEWLTLHRRLPGGRLPHVDSGPPIEGFRLLWDSTPFRSLHVLDVEITGAGFAWAGGFRTPETPDRPFPWVLTPVTDRRWFDDDAGRDDREHGEARHRANVTAARISIESWDDGVLGGRVEFKTTRGVDYDTPFRARLADRDGVLERASRGAPRPPVQGPRPR